MAHHGKEPVLSDVLGEWDAFVAFLFRRNSPHLRARMLQEEPTGLLQAQVHWLADRWDQEGWGDELGAVGWHLKWQLLHHDLCAAERDEFDANRASREKRLQREWNDAEKWWLEHRRTPTLYIGLTRA